MLSLGTVPDPDIYSLAQAIISGDFDHATVADRIVALATKGESSNDILAMVEAFRAASVPVQTRHEVVADLCGTGGAEFRTFNVSTLSSLVAASAGVPVAKHGKSSYRGVCGSADIMRSLGARISLTSRQASRLLDGLDFVFLFAPEFHPAMKRAAPLRKQIGKRTVFNMIGPLLNPVRAKKRQLMGVYEPVLLETVPYVLDALGTDRAIVVHGFPGMDEVSTLGTTQVAFLNKGSIDRLEIVPSELGISVPSRAEVAELPPSEAVIAAREVMTGAEGPKRDMVVINTAAALFAYGRVGSLDDGMRIAEEAIDSGKALKLMERYIDESNAGGE